MRLLVRGPDGRARRIPVAGRLVLGRSRHADLVLEGRRVSRRHAAVELRNGRLVVEDLGSSNGTWLGGERIAGPRAVAPGREVRIGGWTVAAEADGGDTVPERRVPPETRAVEVEDRAVAAEGRRRGEGRRAAAAGGGRGAAAARNGSRSRGRRAGGLAATAAVAVGAVAALGWAAAPAAAGEGGGEAAAAAPGEEGASARLARWRVELAGARVLFSDRQATGDWAGAREALERLAHLDPLDPGIAPAREALAREEGAAEREARARELASLGRDEEALALFLQIPRSSWHHGRARDAAARLLRERLVPAKREACLRALSGARPAGAPGDCRSYLDLTCHQGLDEQVAAAVRRRERTGREAPWACPPELGAWLAEDAAAGGDDGPERAIRQRYGDPAVAEALLLHFREGRTRGAREALEKLASGAAGSAAGRSAAGARRPPAGAPGGARPGGGPPDPGASPSPGRLAAVLEELDGRLLELRSRLLAGDLEAAEAALARATDLEEELVPGIGSPALAGGRSALAAAHRDLGEEHLALGREGLAFASFRRAATWAPADPALRRGFERLESRAASRLDGDPSCAAAAAAVSLTTPGGTTHRRASERLASPACRDVGGF